MPADRHRTRGRSWPYAHVGLVLVLGLLVLAIALGSGPAPRGPAERDDPRVATEASRAMKDEPPSAEAEPPSRAAAASSDASRARRDRVRARILEALARNESSATDEAEARAVDGPGPGRDDPAAPSSTGIRDRIGGRDALVAALDDDFLPLAQECITAAQERDPELEGMLAIGLQVIADPEIGAVVEAVDFPETGEVHEALLHECIRETSLSTILPPPPEGGREELMLTLPIERAQDSA